jgi:hypothetical protein
MEKALTRQEMVNKLVSEGYFKDSIERMTDRYLKFLYDKNFNGLMDGPLQEDGYHLFGLGDLHDYGDYTLVVAKTKEEAKGMFLQNNFMFWLEGVIDYENSVKINGNNVSSYVSEKYSEYNKDGVYEMTDEQLFEYYKEHCPIKDDEIVDLKTRVWNGDNA